MRRHYIPAIHSRIGDLRRIDGNDAHVSNDELVLISVARNAVPRLDRFFDYYRKLGVGKFIIVDNVSYDDTVSRLLEERDVILYQTTDSYARAGYGMRWVNELIDRHGRRSWCLDVDPDELLIFPHCERLGLRHLVDYLDRNSFQAMSAVMLDMYPASLTDKPLTDEAYQFFDNRLYAFSQSVCPYVEWFGGIRRRLFRGYQLMSKAPLINGAAGIRYLLAEHCITPARVADVSSALLHYHLVAAFDPVHHPSSYEAVAWREVVGNSHERHRVRENLPRLLGESLLAKDSIKFQASEQLIDLGLIAEGNLSYRMDCGPG